MYKIQNLNLRLKDHLFINTTYCIGQRKYHKQQ